MSLNGIMVNVINSLLLSDSSDLKRPEEDINPYYLTKNCVRILLSVFLCPKVITLSTALEKYNVRQWEVVCN